MDRGVELELGGLSDACLHSFDVAVFGGFEERKAFEDGGEGAEGVVAAGVGDVLDGANVFKGASVCGVAAFHVEGGL